MSAHGCIGNPCWLCHPELRPVTVAEAWPSYVEPEVGPTWTVPQPAPKPEHVPGDFLRAVLRRYDED